VCEHKSRKRPYSHSCNEVVSIAVVEGEVDAKAKTSRG
jgi:hypothetical protein